MGGGVVSDGVEGEAEVTAILLERVMVRGGTVCGNGTEGEADVTEGSRLLIAARCGDGDGDVLGGVPSAVMT